MGTFILAFIGNGFVRSAQRLTQGSSLLAPIPATWQRRLLVAVYFAAIVSCVTLFGAMVSMLCTLGAPLSCALSYILLPTGSWKLTTLCADYSRHHPRERRLCEQTAERQHLDSCAGESASWCRVSTPELRQTSRSGQGLPMIGLQTGCSATIGSVGRARAQGRHHGAAGALSAYRIRRRPHRNAEQPELAGSS